MILAVLNNKGGVGKTTTAVNLAAGISWLGHRTLLIDLDSQASASFSLGIVRANLEPSSANVLLDELPIHKAIRQTEHGLPLVGGELDLVTGSMRLANADVILADEKGRENRLRNTLSQIRKEYDYIILDCPPSMSLIPINALVASDSFIVPVTPHYLALEGLVNLTESVEKIRQGIGTVAPLMGLVITMADRRTKVAGEVSDIIREHFGEKVFNTEIPMNVRLTEAPSFGKCIFDYDNSSTGATAYRSLTTEVLQRCRV